MTAEAPTGRTARRQRVGFPRRLLDLLAGSVGLLVVCLPLLLLMLAVRLESRGPALFRQIRLGERGRPFILYKLRTMRTGSTGLEITTADDPRVTRLGRLLRRTSLDELPQLWHVVRGQMTLVGPRPETPALAEAYPPDCRWVLDHRPGLTGPAQVRLRDTDILGTADANTTAAYLSQIVPARTAIEAVYLRNPTLAATLGVLVDTVRHLLGRPVPPQH
ncbi:sugar transferase [Dactylosporangium fulvum]|uniref:Sugar transferase n=1 Tax=Dactylosporangium fulvum TaxID=53359 RepID=A0ABY5W848_9ACTN|nr:sugar transferase [Dactylosporangium fulvum]UWP85491.1 sugar transferase [Dactylosporangium fulvum]